MKPTRGALSGILLIVALPYLVGWSFFDPFHEFIEKGNSKAKKGDAPAAVTEYDNAARVRPSSPIPDFNKGVALARSGQGDAAREALLGASASEDHAVAADALYNVGNTFLGEKHPKEAVESYLKSLDLDPNDADARRNLEIALRRVEQQKQQQQNKQDDSKQDQKQEKKQDQKPDQKQEPKEQPQDQPQEDQKPQPTPGDSTQTMPDRLTREDAERLLNAIQSDEMKVLGQVRKQDEAKEGPTHDW